MNGRSSRTRAKTRKFDPKMDYPLACKRPDLVKTPSGKSFEDITLEDVASGKIDSREFRIRPETLEMQARISEAHGRMQLSLNFLRAAELFAVPDEEVFKVYDAMRPHRSTEKELLQIAEELEKKYQAKLNAQLIREAARAYRMRHLLRESHTTAD